MLGLRKLDKVVNMKIKTQYIHLYIEKFFNFFMKREILKISNYMYIPFGTSCICIVSKGK